MNPVRVRRRDDLFILDHFRSVDQLDSVTCRSLVTNTTRPGTEVLEGNHPFNVVTFASFSWQEGGFSVVLRRLPEEARTDELSFTSAPQPSLSDAEKKNPSQQARNRVDGELRVWSETRAKAEKVFVDLYSTLSLPVVNDPSVAEVLAQASEDFRTQIANLRSTTDHLARQHVEKVDEAKRNALEEVKNERASLQAEFDAKIKRRNEELDRLEAELKSRLAEIDTQEAKFARRQRRKDLLHQLFFDALPEAATNNLEASGSTNRVEPPEPDSGKNQPELPTGEASLPQNHADIALSANSIVGAPQIAHAEIEQTSLGRLINWLGLPRRTVAAAKPGRADLQEQLRQQGRKLVATSVILMALFLGAEITLFLLGGESWQMWVARGAFGLAFATTTTYLLRWLDIRYRRAEEEQIYRRRLSFDVSRAEWLVETMLEYGKERNGEIMPETVITALSRGLFDGVPGSRRAHIADEIANALQGKIRITSGDQTVEIDRTQSKDKGRR